VRATRAVRRRPGKFIGVIELHFAAPDPIQFGFGDLRRYTADHLTRHLFLEIENNFQCAVAVNVLPIDDHLADIDPDPEPYLPLLRQLGVKLLHALLYRHRTFNRSDGACKLDQDAIASRADHATAVLLDLRCPEFLTLRLHGRERGRLVGFNELRVTNNIGS